MKAFIQRIIAAIGRAAQFRGPWYAAHRCSCRKWGYRHGTVRVVTPSEASTEYKVPAEDAASSRRFGACPRCGSLTATATIYTGRYVTSLLPWVSTYWEWKTEEGIQ